MTLGGLAVAIGALVDDAIVGRGERLPAAAARTAQARSPRQPLVGGLPGLQRGPQARS